MDCVSLISSNVDYSVDPCDNFFAHVCPVTSENHFMRSLVEIKNKIVDDYKAMNPMFDDFSYDKTSQTADTIRQLLQSGELRKLCVKKEKLVTLFTRHLLKFEVSDTERMERWKALSCEGKLEMIKQLPDPARKYKFSRYILKEAIDASIANSQMKKLDGKVRKLFKKLKLAVLKQLRKTPWAIRNGAVEMYESALQNINFTTFSNLQPSVQNLTSGFVKARRECVESLNGEFSEEIEYGICEVIAVGEGLRALSKPIESVYSSDMKDILKDSLEMWNSQDNHVYVGNDFLLMANTDYLSDLYGGIGFSLTHEILHTLVFDYRDVLLNKTLAPFWTKDSKCVEEQTMKTCETFPTVTCNSTITFEEDAADLAAYRIVWNVYQKEYGRKTVVPNYESLDKKQLFFYGAAVVFCYPNAMNPTSVPDFDHSSSYQRINSLMSQMEQFSDAFKCKPTDKMVMNRAKHCELYGSKAQRKHSFGQ
ncbi:hypothetical protein GCK72_006136 [Caenorhabditis remanei]|uniref:Peptidase M13 C-terminal domain-containing protein n=1 Tax=Caenorhabditis remanei TaxID=31234 RepID=A0A6A5HEG6_CAERE|nr:hypothetical protein GCK72_006136 [Caenorhabditis remanei]KAF1766180.1 hypothetical protein GCK72_006136 [Caenorhabditis remanei]